MTRCGRGLLAVLAAAVIAAPGAHADQGSSAAVPSATAASSVEGPFRVAGGADTATGTGTSTHGHKKEAESDSRSVLYWVALGVCALALAGVAAYVLKLRRRDDPRLPAGEVW